MNSRARQIPVSRGLAGAYEDAACLTRVLYGHAAMEHEGMSASAGLIADWTNEEEVVRPSKAVDARRIRDDSAAVRHRPTGL